MKASATDSIAAIATHPGEGAIGIIRISGGNSFAAAEAIVYPHRKATNLKPFKLYHGWVRDGIKYIDEVMLVKMKGPRSYTGEDMIEIQAHGGPGVLAYILKMLTRNGIRLADPGEFTKRAFLNGKIDLTQAESVAWLIEAKSDAEIRSAARQLSGEAGADLGKIKKELVHVLASLEASIDFQEFEYENVSQVRLYSDMRSTLKKVRGLLRKADSGETLRRGVKIAIVGKPNVGKSSLLNALLDQERAIVTPYPGTTRDTIEESTRIEGMPVILIDTAGIRKYKDEIEKEGVKRSKDKIREADFILTVLDRGTEINRDDLETLKLIRSNRAIIVINKSDLPSRMNLKRIKHELLNRKVITISATKRLGLSFLKREIAKLIRREYRKISASGVFISLKRKIRLEKAMRLMENALNGIKGGRSTELLADDLRKAYDYICEIIGERYSEEILDDIFSRFCLGK